MVFVPILAVLPRKSYPLRGNTTFFQKFFPIAVVITMITAVFLW